MPSPGFGLLWLSALLGLAAMLPADVQTVVPTDGMQVSADVTLASGTYLLKGGIDVAADGVVLDGNGATLLGVDQQGSGIRLRGRREVTIKNVRIRNYYHGIELRDCERITITACSIRGTGQMPDGGPGRNAVFIWKAAENPYGAGILAVGVRHSVFEQNDLQHQQNGISLHRCSKCKVIGNNASFCSGWGFHLNNSSDNLLRDNVADFCNRVYRFPNGQSYYIGGEAAGLLMVTGSSGNRVLGNRLRCGGDGVFLAGYRPGAHRPCDGNLFEQNDVSCSTNNGFEATFSSGNVFRDNVANRCNYGFWLGYSGDTTVEDNQIRYNHRAGISIEHGLNNRLDGNEIIKNDRGIHLWTDLDKDFLEPFPEHAPSQGTVIERNTIEENRTGVLLASDGDLPEPLCRRHRLVNNIFRNNVLGINLTDAVDVVIQDNLFESNTWCGLLLTGKSTARVIGNTFADYSPAWVDSTHPQQSLFEGNWWLGHKGDDANGDGCVDAARVITTQDGGLATRDLRPLTRPTTKPSR